MFKNTHSTIESRFYFGKSVKSFRKGFAMMAAIVMLLAATAIPAFPQSPAATLRLVNSQNGYQLGTVEVFTTTSNTFGFWARIWMNGGKVRTVAPFRTNADGSISLWFIEYSYYAGAPLDTKYWSETYSGQIQLTMSTATSTSVDGFMITTAQLVGYQRVSVRDQWYPIRITA